MSQKPDAPVSITSARESHSDDVHRRMVKYLFSMGLRTVCFVLAIVTTGPVRWTMVAAAVFLPYVAVVIANASDGRGHAGPAEFEIGVEPLPRLESAEAQRRLDHTVPPRTP